MPEKVYVSSASPRALVKYPLIRKIVPFLGMYGSLLTSRASGDGKFVH